MKKFLFSLAIITLFLPITSGLVFADEPQDLTYTINSSNVGDSHDFCGYSGAPSCDGYQYVSWTTTNSTLETHIYVANTVKIGSTARTNRLNLFPAASQSYSESISNLTAFRVSGSGLSQLFSADSNATVTVTLSSSVPGCSACPDCPDCPDCSEPFIVGLFKQGFWGVATGLVSIIVPILALFLVFRLVHDLIFRDRM